MIIGPHLKSELLNPGSFFWRHPANYNIHPMAFQDRKGRYLACNLSFANMVRHAVGDVPGKRPADLFEPEVARAMDDARRNPSAHDEEAVFEFWQTFGHGPRLHVTCWHGVVVSPQGPIGFLSQFFDNTFLYRAETGIRETMQILRHDLQNPLAASMFYLDEHVAPACRGTDGEPAATILQALNRQVRDLIRACFQVHERIRFSPPLLGEWTQPAALIQDLDRELKQQLAARGRVVADLRDAEDLLWPREALLSLLLGLIRLAWEAAGEPPPPDLTVSVAVRSETHEHRIAVEMPIPRFDAQTADILLVTRMEVLEAKAKGVGVRVEPGSSSLRLSLGIPRTEMVPRGAMTDTPAEKGVRDYSGEAFNAPGSWYQARFDLASECVAVLDSEHRISACSLRFAQLFGCLPDQLLRRHYRDFASTVVVSILEDLLTHPLDPGRFKYVLRLLFNETAIAWTHIVVASAVEGSLVIHVYNRSQEEFVVFLKRHVKDAFRLVQSRLEHLRDHYAQLLRNPAASAALHADLTRLSANNEEMLELTKAWTQLESLDSGQYPFRPQPLALRPLLESVLDEVAWQNGPVSLRMPGTNKVERTLTVCGDPALLKSLFLNLLRNACQASRKHDIAMTVQPVGRQVLIDIRNDGEVPSSIRGNFFGKLVKGPESSGMGLGTYSAKLAAEMHGGQIALDTSEPGYTLLRVTLPLQDATAAATASQPPDEKLPG